MLIKKKNKTKTNKQKILYLETTVCVSPLTRDK